MSLEARVAQLEQRVAQLAESSQGETLTPNYLTVNPDGSTGAIFTGGLQLIEGPVGQIYRPAESVGWQDAGGVNREFIEGYSAGAGSHALVLESIADAADFAFLLCSSKELGAAASVIASAEDSQSGVGAAQATIINSRGASTLLQIGPSGAALYSSIGTGVLTWGAGTPVSIGLDIPLTSTAGLAAAGTVHAVALATGPVGATPGVVWQALPDGAGGVGFQGRTIDGTNPGAGATMPFAYLMWGV